MGPFKSLRDNLNFHIILKMLLEELLKWAPKTKAATWEANVRTKNSKVALRDNVL